MSKNHKPKITVGVLMGGPSSEHDVSLATGRNIIDNLDRSRYEPLEIKISKEKEWFLNGQPVNEQTALKSCNLVFNALHGAFGEDGKVQALMEYYDTRYTGSGICGSALAMDKLRSREIFKLSGLKVPNTLKIRRKENYHALLNLFVSKVTSFPVVVKPCSGGSSVGVQIVNNNAELEKAVKAAFKLEGKILVEEFIGGREVTCGVLENFNGQSVGALPVTEIIPKKEHKFFDYNAKYKTGHSDEITPAFLDADMAKEVQNTAIKTHQILGCKAYSRTDMIIKNNDIYVLEVNTLPGLTANSLLPKAAQAAGLTLGQLLDMIIASSLA